MAFNNALFIALTQGGMPPSHASRIAESTISVGAEEKRLALIYTGIEPAGASAVANATATAAERKLILSTRYANGALTTVNAASAL